MVITNNIPFTQLLKCEDRFAKADKCPKQFTDFICKKKTQIANYRTMLETIKSSFDLGATEMVTMGASAKTEAAAARHPSALDCEDAREFWMKHWNEAPKTEWGSFYQEYERTYNSKQKMAPLRDYLNVGAFVEIHHVKSMINDFGWPVAYDAEMIATYTETKRGKPLPRGGSNGGTLKHRIQKVLGVTDNIFKAILANNIPEVVKMLQQDPARINKVSADKNGWTALHLASFQGSVELVQRMVDMARGHIDKEFPDVDGRRAIDLAAQMDHLEIVQLLYPIYGSIKFGAAARGASARTMDWLLEQTTNALEELTKTYKQSSAIHQAASWGNLPALRAIAASGVDIDHRDANGRTAVHCSLSAEEEEVLVFLCGTGGAGADIDACDNQGMTPLMHAVLHKPAEIAKRLLELNADPDAANPNTDRTPLFLCALREDLNTAIIHALVEHGADVNYQDAQGRTPMHALSEVNPSDAAAVQVARGMVDELVAVGADIDAQDYDGNTPLAASAEGGVVPVLDKLLTCGADPQPRNVDQQTPMHSAATPEVVDRLVQAGASVNVADAVGNTPLHVHAQGGRAGLVQSLLEHGSKPQATNFVGDTPLHCACDQAAEDCVQALLGAMESKSEEEKKVFVNQQNRKGQTATHRAVQVQSVPIIASLGNAGADAGVADKHGNTPLHMAAALDNREVMDAALTLPTVTQDILDKPNMAGDTPLIVSCSFGTTESTQLLLGRGASTGAQNHAGLTASKAATIGGHSEVVDLLADSELHMRRSAGQGVLKVGLLWETKDDLDLSVITPAGNRIYFYEREYDGGLASGIACAWDRLYNLNAAFANF